MRFLVLTALALPLLADSRHEKEQAQEIQLIKGQNAALTEQLNASRGVRTTAARLKAENEGLHTTQAQIEQGKRTLDQTKLAVDTTSDHVDIGVVIVGQIKEIVTEESRKQEGRARRQLYFSTVFAILLGVGFYVMISGMRKNYSDLAAIAKSSLARVDSATNEALQQRDLYQRLKANLDNGEENAR